MSNSLFVITIMLCVLCGTRAAIAVATKERVFWWEVVPIVWLSIVLVGCVAR